MTRRSTVLKTFSATMPEDRATCTTTNESSPICVSPAATGLRLRLDSERATRPSSKPETCRPQ